nr:isoprenylcysteine carboxylmethyltransferase family protein [Leucobacter exalbidus]
MQAAAGALWWVGVFTLPWVRHTTLGELNPVVVGALDIPLFVLASAAVALGLRSFVWVVVPWTVIVTMGLAVYATVTGLAGWGVLIMVAASGGGLAAGLLVWLKRIPTEWIVFGPFRFRAAPAGRAGYLGQTFGQIVVFWGACLVLIPGIIAVVESRWGLSIQLPLWARIAGGVLLLVASALGIWSAVTMSTLGSGTPLPSAMPRLLVIAGPYRFVRNPMAVAGITQGIAVGLIASSWLVVVYALCGSLIWNWVVRPHEEADLEAKFGPDFAAYRERVSCWVPRRPRAGAPRR